MVVAALLFRGTGGGYRVSATFEYAGQLVKGNEVDVGGRPVGTISDIELTDEGRARVRMSLDEFSPVHVGTRATIRANSLSGIANRYVALELGPDSAPAIDDGGQIESDKLTAPVDLDQLFNTLDAPTRGALQQFVQFLRDVNPILDWLGLYKAEIASFFALDVAATQAVDRPPGASGPVHYLRTANPLNPENLAAYPRRIATNRPNPYVAPGGSARKPGQVFGTYACGTAAIPPLAPPGATPRDPVDLQGVPVPLPIEPGGPVDQLSDELRDLINTYAYNDGDPVAPPCQEQAPLGGLVGQGGKCPHVLEAPGR